MDNYFRCPWCGSSAVSTETKKEGYDIKKGLIGTALFGTGGAVMGINMNEKKYNYCQMCRKTFTQCMPVATIKDIERLLRDSNGDHPLLKMYKNHYPNFEMDNVINTNNSSVNINELNAEELADTLYEYCKKNQIKEIKKSDLEKRIAGEWLINGFDALDILEERGVAEYNLEKSKSDDGMWYNFYLTEEEIEQKVIRDGGFDDEKLANKIYKYCKDNFITRLSREKIFEAIADGHIENGDEALSILEERGLLKEFFEDKEFFYDFYLDEESIKSAKEKILIRNGEMDAEELANRMYQYCKDNNISYITYDDLCKAIADDYIDNGTDAMNILENRGWAECDLNASDWCYNFFLTEKEIEKNAIREGKLDNKTLANIIYQYCKDNNISNINITTLSKVIADADKIIVELFDGLDILEEQGLVECDVEKTKSTDESWYNFKIDRLENGSDRAQKGLEDKSIEEIKKLKELLDLDIITQEEFDKKKKELLNV